MAITLDLVNKSKGGKKVKFNEVLKLNEGFAIPKTLDSIDNTIKDNKDLFGFFKNTLANLDFTGAFTKRRKTKQAELRAASQQFGRYMEGGVLRKEDERKYERMFPNFGEPVEVAQGKLQVVNQMLKRRQDSDVEALARAGFDVSPWAPYYGGNVDIATQQEERINEPINIDPDSLGELDALFD